MMKWIIIALGLALVGGGYFVISRGGALEMQPEHAVEAPAHTKAAAPK